MNVMLNLLSGLLTLSAYVPYIRAILRGETRPSRVSWTIWAVVGLLLLTSYRSLGSEAALGLATGAFLGQLLVALLSIKYGVRGMTAFDGLCVAGALIAGVLWWLTSSPFLPHVLTVILDACAWLPTFRKTLRHPHEENVTAWMLWTAGAVVAMANIHAWTISNALFPVYIVATDGIMFLLLLKARTWR